MTESCFWFLILALFCIAFVVTRLFFCFHRFWCHGINGVSLLKSGFLITIVNKICDCFLNFRGHHGSTEVQNSPVPIAQEKATNGARCREGMLPLMLINIIFLYGVQLIL